MTAIILETGREAPSDTICGIFQRAPDIVAGICQGPVKVPKNESGQRTPLHQVTPFLASMGTSHSRKESGREGP